jgi:hypothetical protein
VKEIPKLLVSVRTDIKPDGQMVQLADALVNLLRRDYMTHQDDVLGGCRCESCLAWLEYKELMGG